MDLLSFISEKFSDLWDQLVAVLPKCPLYYFESDPEVKKYIGYINWFIPVESMITIATGWLSCIAVFYVYQVILRWAKVVE